MSLLSDTQYTPQRIYSLLQLLEAEGGQATFESILTWMKPKSRGYDLRGGDNDHTSIRQLIGAASSLEFVTSPALNVYSLARPAPSDIGSFADEVHDHLVSVDEDDADAIVLEAFAAMVVLTEAEQGTGWLEAGGPERAARMDKAVRPAKPNKDGKVHDRFNSTKWAPWARWMAFLGLGLTLPTGEFFPYPVQRLERELMRRVSSGADPVMDVTDVMRMVAERMPYLDGGRFFEESARRASLPSLYSTVSRVLSGALRDLNDDGRIRLQPVGDETEMYQLTREPHSIGAFKTMTIKVANA